MTQSEDLRRPVSSDHGQLARHRLPAPAGSCPYPPPVRRTLLLLLLVLLVPAGASAQVPDGPQGVGVVPAPDDPRRSPSGTFLELGRVQAGVAVVGTVVVRNQGSASRLVLLYASDALPSRGGGFAFTDRLAPDKEVGRWLTLATDHVTVPASGEARVGYRLVVPSGTQGGEYVGGVVAEPPPPTGSGVRTTTRVAMSVYLTVPGGAPGATPGRGRPDGRLVLDDVQPGKKGGRTCPVVRYSNDSQQVLDPSLEVSTNGTFGGSSYRRARTGAVLPGSSARVPLPCLDRPLGPSTLRVRLRTPEGVTTDQSRDLYVPWPVVVSLLLLLLLLAAVVTTGARGLLAKRSAGPVDEGSSPS
ncbi:MAG: putative protein of unknown function cell surface [Frankiales bacterium]|nr:putative protein of unknown function cell surface [Frankiales bacterium]